MGSLLDRSRQLALEGHDLDQLLDQAIDLRPIDNVHSIAGVLHWRLAQVARRTQPVRRPGPLRSLLPADTSDEHLGLARAAGELIRRRWQQIRTRLEGHDGPLPFARALGFRPDDAAEARSWLTAATAVTAYRERYELPDYIQLLGERPGPLRPDAQAAHDHARLQVDQHLARPYRHLDLHQLERLRQEHARAEPPAVEVNPAELQAAHSDTVDAQRRWRSATTPQRAATKQAHERSELAVGALERLTTRRVEHDQHQQDHSDRRRRIEISFARRSRR